MNSCKPSSQVSSCRSLTACEFFSLPISVSLHILVYHPFMCVVIMQAADMGLTPPPPPGLARPSGPFSLSSNTTGGSKGNASFSNGMPTAYSQLQGTRGSAPALAPAARGGFGSGLTPEMLSRLGNGDGKPFGEQGSGSDRGQGNRQADTNRPGLSNNRQIPPITTDSIPHGQPGSELRGSNVGESHSSGVAPAPASSGTRHRGPPAHLEARLSRNPFEDDHVQADRHQTSGTAASQGSSGSGVSNRGRRRGRGRYVTSGAHYLHGRQQQQGGPIYTLPSIPLRQQGQRQSKARLQLESPARCGYAAEDAPDMAGSTWAAQYNTLLLIELAPKGVVCSFLFMAASSCSTQPEDRNNIAAAQQQAAASTVFRTSGIRKAGICVQISHTHFRSCSQKPKGGIATAGMPLAAMATEHEDRNKVAAAQFKE